MKSVICCSTPVHIHHVEYITKVLLVFLPKQLSGFSHENIKTNYESHTQTKLSLLAFCGKGCKQGQQKIVVC